VVSLIAGRLFERDVHGQVLWFSGPPLAPGTTVITPQAAHSLEYLDYLTKRKRGEELERQVFKRKAGSEYHSGHPWWSTELNEVEVLQSWKRI
jgi:hypothetical protein